MESVTPTRIFFGSQPLRAHVPPIAIVLYLVFFLPMAMTVFASVMMNLMGNKAAMMLPNVLLIGLIGHILYGFALGATAFYVGKKL